MSGLPITPATAASAPSPAPRDERAKLAEAARRFEAIFVRQMLASARQAGFGDTLFGSQATDTFRTMQDERFADLVAHSGALGIAQAVERQLSATLAPSGVAKP